MDEVRRRELAEGEPLEVFRLVHVSSAADAGLLEDMASNAAKSRPPRGREIRQPAVHDGVSVFKSRAQAVARRRRIVETVRCSAMRPPFGRGCCTSSAAGSRARDDRSFRRR